MLNYYQVPFDISPFLKLGTVGILLLIIILLLFVGFKFLNTYVLKFNNNGSKSSIRELTAGEKSAEFWLTEGRKIYREENRMMLEYLGKLRARLRNIEDKSDTIIVTIDRMEASQKKHDAQIRADLIAIAKAVAKIKDN